MGCQTGHGVSDRAWGIRPGMGCLSTLLRLVEDWRKALDSHEYVAAILMDLTKASDCLPHSLLLGKRRAYVLLNKSCSLFNSYLSHTKQRVKLGPQYSEWADMLYPKALLWALFFSLSLLMIFKINNYKTINKSGRKIQFQTEMF